MSALKDAILSFTPVTSNPLLHKYFIDRLLFLWSYIQVTAGSSFRLNDQHWKQDPAVFKCRSWTLKIMVHAGAQWWMDPPMKLCYVFLMRAVNHRAGFMWMWKNPPLQKMLSFRSSGPRPFVSMIDELPVIKLTCWQTLICFISWMTCMEVFFLQCY